MTMAQDTADHEKKNKKKPPGRLFLSPCCAVHACLPVCPILNYHTHPPCQTGGELRAQQL